jgi:1-phosphofructokinase
MTLVICPNLALDRIVRLPELTPGTTMRGHAIHQQAGGKGTNVVRALAQLGGRGLLGGFAAGGTGRLIAEEAVEEGLDIELVIVGGESKVSTVVLEESGRASAFFEVGPQVDEADQRALVELIAMHPAAPGEWAVVDGSVPPGCAPTYYGTLVEALHETDYHVLVDAEGEQLRGALGAAPEIVKVNLTEARSAVGEGSESAGGGPESAGGASQPGDIDGARAACARLIAAGALSAVITLGAQGALGLLNGRALRVTSPALTVRNAVGSGDVFAAALLLAYERGEPVEAALRAAAATAAANAASERTAHFDLELARRLIPTAEVTEL